MSNPSARQELARLIEHTMRHSRATRADIERHCNEARTHGFASVCVNGSRVMQAVHLLEESDVKVACAVGFPLGASDTDVKRFETESAIDHGAHFIEVTANLGWLKDGDDARMLREFRDVVEAADERPVSLQLEAAFLSVDELQHAAALAVEAGMKGVTITVTLGGSTLTDFVKAVREVVPESFGIKADQLGLKLPDSVALLEAGATRFGLVESVPLMESIR